MLRLVLRVKLAAASSALNHLRSSHYYQYRLSVERELRASWLRASWLAAGARLMQPTSRWSSQRHKAAWKACVTLRPAWRLSKGSRCVWTPSRSLFYGRLDLLLTVFSVIRISMRSHLSASGGSLRRRSRHHGRCLATCPARSSRRMTTGTSVCRTAAKDWRGTKTV
jgi:hypothetical protein